ncbi:FAD-dependent oxidoreductase [Nevskia sp.]|uniref:FAD-dependent oxidoreductase n=2 Tax=Nevskia TaxID=64001 RepID=UPI0025E81AEC|nr:FAD-dependent oxidoreductase [Nevskia sp.]
MIDKKTAAVGDEPQLRTRRALLKGLAAGSVAAAGSLPSLSHAAGPAATKWTAEADVLIVGTGIAGTAAALAAASKGASVIMLEKMPFKGGTTAKSGGVFWIPDNAWLASQGIADNRADALRYMVRLSYPHRYVESDALLGIGQAEYDLIATFFDNAAKVVRTLSASTGLKPMPWYTWEGKPFPDYYAQLPECKVPRGRSLVPDITGHAERIVWPQNGGGGESLLWQLQQGFDKLPIQMLLEHQVQDLVRDNAGGVIGLKVDRGDAEPVNFRAKKAVIFCSGGFTHSVELSRAHLKGHIWGGCAAPGSTGDFIAIAQKAGAVLGNMANAWWGQIAVEVALKTRSVPQDIWSTPGDSMIQVNRYGHRWVNEKIQYDERAQSHFVWDPVKAEYPNLLGFMIWDSRTAKHFAGYDPIPAANAKLDHVIEGKTLEELAKNIESRLAGIAAKTGNLKLDKAFLANLKASIKRYNGFAKAGRDPDFSRGEAPIETAFHFMAVPKVANPNPNLLMHPIADAGPYYATIVGAGTLDTKGGPVVNSQGQVLDAQRKPIPGLYAAGNCVAAPAGQAYWAGGGTIGPAMTFGYLAGTAALTEPVRSA